MTTLKLGKLPPDLTKKALSLAPHLTGTLTPPAQRDWLSEVTDWPMYANDRYGDCVFAAVGHMIEAWTAYNGSQIEVTTEDLLHAYSAVTGFDPNDPSTDQGTRIQDALNYWRRTGIAGHKILAFAKVDHTNPTEVKVALDTFGALMIGIRFPRAAMDQFNSGQPWDVLRNDGGIEGGHAIHGGAYKPGDTDIVTWAKVQPMTDAFATKYVDEVWAVITPEWYAATGKTPGGVDLAGLGQALADITGEPSPFPPNNPPAPVGDSDTVFAKALRRGDWINHPHLAGNARVAKAARAWLQAKGL
jgi:hypothetical protein